MIDATRLAALAIISVIVAVHAVYGGYWAARLVPTAMELAFSQNPSQSPVFAVIWPVWSGALGLITGIDAALANRAFSIGCSTLAILTVYRLNAGLAGDRVAAAGTCLLLIAFPPATAVWALATPHGAAGLSVAALLAASHGRPSRLKLAVAAGSAGVLIALHPMGLTLAGLALVPAGANPQGRIGRRLTWRIAAAAFLVAGIAATAARWVQPFADIDVANLGHTGPIQILIYPYALVWTVLVLSMLALRSPAVRQRLGVPGCASSIGAAVAVLGWAATAGVGGAFAPGQALTGFVYILPLAALAALPLAVWVRFVMPTVKSLAAWILFPVIMYSGFWLVLGPIDLGRFPYAFRSEITDSRP